MAAAGNPPRAPGRALLAALAALAVAILPPGCVTTEPEGILPEINISPEQVRLDAPAGPAAGVDLGLEVEANETDTLEGLERLPGARVRRVEPGGPAAAAGLRAGDVILSAGGAAVNDGGGLEAMARRAGPGNRLELEARRGTVVFRAELVPRAPPAGTPPRELYRADPLRARAGFRTVVDDSGGAPRPAAEVAAIFDGSPLPVSGIEIGDRIIAIDGEPIRSAQDLVWILIEERDPGDRVRLVVRRGGEERIVKARLWDPGRRLSRLELWPLFGYLSTLRPDRTRFALLDFWLFSIFEYDRRGGEAEYRILTFIRFGTGHGELIEEKPAPEAAR